MIKKLKSKTFVNACAILTSLLFLFQYFVARLRGGGCWDLLEHVAMADRCPNFGYTLGAIDNYTICSPYFPGVGLLAVILHPIFGEYDIEALLFFATLSLFGVLAASYIIYKKIDEEPLSFPVYLCIVLAFAHYFLKPYINYAVEFKPDSISILFIILSIYALSKKGILNGVLLYIGIFFAILFKQQSGVPIFALTCCVLLLEIPFKEKIRSISIIVIGVLSSSTLILMIPGALDTTIIAHTALGRVPFQLWEQLKILIFVCTCFAFARKNETIVIIKHIFKRRCLYLFIPACTYLIVQILGSIRWGGNAGNTATGFLLIIPFIIFSWKNIIKENIVFLIISAIIMIQPAYIGYKLRDDYPKWKNIEVSLNQQIRDLKIKKIVICDDSYATVRGIPFEKILAHPVNPYLVS